MGKRPSLFSGSFKLISLLVLSTWVLTEGGALSAHINSHPNISASICKSNTTGIPSGPYSSCAFSKLSINSSSLCNSLSAVTPVKLPT